jgi:hypothetical protein
MESNDEFHNLYFPSNVRLFPLRRVRWIGHVASMEKQEMYTNFGCKPCSKITLQVYRHGWEDNIKMNLRKNMKT